MSSDASQSIINKNPIMPKVITEDKLSGEADKKGTILVVDDDLMMRKLASMTLRRENYQVLLAESGAEALECVAANRPDLILLDCSMPEMDGYETCRRIRSDTGNNDIPIIFLTAKTATEDKIKGFATGGSDYLTKPIEYVELVVRIQTHLELARHRSQLRQQNETLENLLADQSGRLDQVRRGQERLLANPEDFPEIKIAVNFVPAFEAGGDFYDIVRLSEDQIGFIMADVAGHDLGTAYLTGALKALTVSFTNEAMSVDDSMLMMNTALGRFLDTSQYATACYVKYLKQQKVIHIINAGHPNAIILKQDGSLHCLELTGDVLGIHDTVICESESLQVNTGERLFLYTDGLIEGYPDSQGNIGSRITGSNRLHEQIKVKAELPLKDMVESIINELLDECNGSIGDDVVLMGIEF
ncbi:MAG: fused response regulator/phosphatase [Planctomycetes bacterium]|nr:fused response regulator/phosphatase [Planctomycetota bacterium]